ncbi:MAG: acetyl-CoA carboxylase biotin carboxyl carrier protein subunit [Bacteroidota bacterium]
MTEYVVTINNRRHLIKIFENGQVMIDNKKAAVEISPISNNAYIMRYGRKVFEIASNKLDKNKFGFLINGYYFNTTVRTLLQETAEELQKNKSKAKHHSDVKAPMPGLILKMKKKAGDNVMLGEPILLLEAMKMENELRSPSSGIIKEVFFREGQSVEKDSIILTIE